MIRSILKKLPIGGTGGTVPSGEWVGAEAGFESWRAITSGGWGGSGVWDLYVALLMCVPIGLRVIFYFYWGVFVWSCFVSYACRRASICYLCRCDEKDELLLCNVWLFQFLEIYIFGGPADHTIVVVVVMFHYWYLILMFKRVCSHPLGLVFFLAPC